MTPSDPRAELERLRKLKRLRELEAKASGSIPAMSTRETTQFPPQANLPDMRVDAVPAERPSRLNAFAEGARTGLTFGTEDEQRAMRALRAQTGGQVGQALNLAGRVIPGFAAADALTGIVADVTGAGGEFRSALETRRAEEQALREERPVSFMAGEIAGSVAVPVGGSARAATKAGQIAKGIGAGALGGGAYEFASEKGGLQERAQAGLIGAGLGAAAGGLLSSVLPRDIPLGDVLNAELFGAKVDRPVLKTIERILRDSGVAPNDISRGVENIRQRLQSGEVGTGLPTRFKDELIKEFGDNARGLAEAIETQIRGGAAVSGSASDAAVRAMVREDNAAARELFNASLDQFAGSVARPELRNQALERMGTIVEERYKPLLARNIDDLEKRQKLIDVLNQPRMQALASELAEDAEREGIDLQALINRNPAEAAHWMQRNARQLADDRGTVTVTGQVKPDRRMMNRRQDILNALEDAVPEYRDTRMEYGDQYGVLEAVRFANGFLARSKDDIAVADMADEFREMSKAQKDMALASVRSLLAGSAENVKYVGPEVGESALRVAEIGKEPVLRALSEVFGGQGTALADDIKQIVTRFDLNRRINPQATGSDTVPKAQAVQKAIRATQGPIARTIGGLLGGSPLDVVGSAVAGSPLPITAMRMGVKGAGEAADRRAMSTVDRVTQMLLSRPQGRNAFTQGRPGGGGIAGGGGPTGSIIEELATPSEGMSAMPEANPFARAPAAPPPLSGRSATGAPSGAVPPPSGGPVAPAGTAFAAPNAPPTPPVQTSGVVPNPYFGRQSMRSAVERGPSERILAMQADWAPVSEGMSQASVSAGQAAELAQQATTIRSGPERQAAAERVAQAMQAVRAQIADIQAQRAGMATPEDQRLQDLIDLLEPTNDPVLLQTQATMVQQNLARINQAIGVEAVPRPMPPQPSAARRLGFQPTVRDETAVARPRPVAGRYAGARDDIQPMGFGASTPKTPQQAIRFETPGSPEYEAAVAKGLDMSTEARMARAKEMGFDTDTVLYHGTPDSRGIMEEGFKTSKERFGIKDPERVYFFAENKKVADTYADDRRAFDYQGATAETIPVYLKSRNPKVVDWGGRPFRGKEKDGSGFSIRDYIDQARADGHDSVIIRNVIDTYDGKGKPSTIRAVFDPSNIRSVHAAFDPDKAASSQLMAGFPSPNAFVEAGAGSIGGSVAGQQYDITGDGVIDERDVQAGALLGMVGVPAIGAAARRMGRNALAQGDMQTMGIGGDVPKPVQQARQTGYKGADTGESKEWLSAIRKGLRMDTESRMARAREQGYDIPLFHKTNADIKAFDPEKGGRGATFFAGSPEGAQAGAAAGQNEGRYLAATGDNNTSGAPNIMPVLIKSEGIAGLTLSPSQKKYWQSLPEEIALKDYEKIQSEIVKKLGKLGGIPQELYGDSYFIMPNGKKIAARDLRSLSDAELEEVRQFGEEYLIKGPEPKKTYEEVKKTGRDLYGQQVAHYGTGTDEKSVSARYKSEGYTGYLVADEGGLSVAVMEPKNIRSVHAAFDPEKSGSSELLAAVPFAVGGVGAGAAMQDRETVRPPPPVAMQPGPVRPPLPIR